MVNETVRGWLDLWHGLLHQPSIPPFKEPDDMAGVLADFRRDPDRMAKAFAPLPRGDELLTRVQLCIDAEQNHDGLYLVPDPLDATDDELRALVNDALVRGSKSCGIDVPPYPINILRRPLSTAEFSQMAPLIEELGDLYNKFAYDLRGDESDAMQFLNETLYTLAASFEVRGYCLTPLCPVKIRRIDPYEPQIKLWRRGAHAVVRWGKGSEPYWVDVFVR